MKDADTALDRSVAGGGDGGIDGKGMYQWRNTVGVGGAAAASGRLTAVDGGEKADNLIRNGPALCLAIIGSREEAVECLTQSTRKAAPPPSHPPSSHRPSPSVAFPLPLSPPPSRHFPLSPKAKGNAFLQQIALLILP